MTDIYRIVKKTLALVTCFILLLPSVALANSAESPANGMTVSGNQLLRDGQPFYPRGFNMVGLLAPDACTNPDKGAVAARNSFGLNELMAVRDNYKANTVRFQMSQRGLDPTDTLHTQSYVDRVVAGVQLARSLKFTVILSMQDQGWGCGTAHPMASDATIRSWQTIAPHFASDPYVMFELFNEPQTWEDPAGWAQWKDGGAGPLADNQGAPIIGHQQLVQTVRDQGARNVVIADGANKAGRLQGLPFLSDPSSPDAPQIAYAWHPYYYHAASGSTLAYDQSNWESRTSTVYPDAPVIATEWNTNLNCYVGGDLRAPEFLAWLRSKNIGITAHAFDIPNTMVRDLTTWAPTSFDGWGCGVIGPDAGETIQAHYRQLAETEPLPPLDVSAPTVTLTGPAQGSGTVQFVAEANDDIGVTKVEFLIDDESVFTDESAPYTWDFDTLNVSDGTYQLRAKAYDAEGKVGFSGLVPFTVDNVDDIAPTVPTGLTGVAASPTSANISWEAATDDVGVTGYRVFRDGFELAATSSTTFRDDQLTEQTTHTYRVAAFDAAGNQSDQTPYITITTPSAIIEYIVNQSIETDLVGWRGTATSQSLVARSNGAAKAGSYSIKVNNKTTSSARIGFSSSTNSGDKHPVSSTIKGTTYTASGWVKASKTNKKLTLYIQERRPDGSSAGSKTVSWTASHTNWYQLSTTYKATANGNSLVYRIWMDSAASADHFYADMLSLTKPN